MTKTAFVYDKWLSSLGGGEVVACNLAKILSDSGYQTTFISGQIVDSNIIKQKLGIDLSKVKFVQSFNDQQKIINLTKNSDLFINASFWDYSTSSSKKQFYYTSFPSKCSPFSLKSIFRSFIFDVFCFFIKPIENIGESQSIIYFQKPNTKQRLSITITLANFSKSNLKKLELNLENVKLLSKKVLINHFNNQINFQFVYLTLSNSIIINKNINLPENEYSLKFDNIFTSTSFPKFNSLIRSGNYQNPYHKLHSFDQIFANSNFTQKWISTYWNLQAKVLYPPVKLLIPNNQTLKTNKICSVGRFFTLGHGKKQEVMINAFKKLIDQGLSNWELHLAGGLGDEPSSQKYASYLQSLSQGYPIFLHFNQSRSFIEELYQSSKIYWHAAGFGENPSNDPIKFEHFGITPIEAISAGCIPILYNGGGLIEVIKLLNLNENIHLFNSIDQLVSNTKTIIENDLKLPAKFNTQLINSFSQDKFKDLFISNLK